MSSIIASFIIPVLAAYLSLSQIPQFKYKFRELSSDRMAIWVVVGAFLLHTISVYILVGVTFLSQHLGCFSNVVLPLEAGLTKISSLMRLPFDNVFTYDGEKKVDVASIHCFYMVLAVLAILACWRSSPKRKHKYWRYDLRCKEEAIDDNDLNDPLEDLYHYSINNFAPIMLNLKNRKVYIGYIQRLESVFNPDNRKHVTIFPLLSGHRHPDTLKFTIDNNYGFLLLNWIRSQQEENKSLLDIGASKPIPTKDFLKAVEHSLVIKTGEIVSGMAWIPEVHEIVSGSNSSNPANAKTRSTKTLASRLTKNLRGKPVKKPEKKRTSEKSKAKKTSKE